VAYSKAVTAGRVRPVDKIAANTQHNRLPQANPTPVGDLNSVV